MKRFIKVLSVFLLVAVLLPSFANAANNPELTRLSGGSRVHTSLEISKEAYKEAKTVILVGYNGEVDALTGSLLATAKDAPVIFAHQNYLKDIKQRLVDLKTEKVYILGGEGVFTKKLYDEFKDYNPTRIEGNNRFETAVKIAEQSVGKTADEVFLALGVDTYADALSVGAISAKEQKPLLLTGKGPLPKATKDALISMGVKKVDIVGGTGAVPGSVEKELKKLNIQVDRTSGNSREETAIVVAKKFNPNHSSIVVANGWNYADAVVGGYFAAKEDAVLLLTKGDKISKALLDYSSQNKLNTFILGGASVVSLDVAVSLSLNSNSSQVATEDQLRDALANPSIKTIQLKDDIDLNTGVYIYYPVTIEGNNKIITGPPETDDSYTDEVLMNAISVLSDNVIIKDLTVQKAVESGIQFRLTKHGELDNVTLRDNGNQGLLLISAEVKASNIKTINNRYQGIALIEQTYETLGVLPKLTIDSHTHVTSQEGKYKSSPAIMIWNETTNDGWVNGTGYFEKAIDEKINEDGSYYSARYLFYNPDEYQGE